MAIIDDLKNAPSKDDLKALKARIAQLERTVDHQADLLGRRVKKFKAAKRHTDPSWFRVVIPDSHGSRIDKPAAAAFLRDLGYLNPREIVLIGDHLDCDGFLAQHHVLGYVAQAKYTFVEDVAEANAFLDSVSDQSPDSEKHYIEGNHEGRIEKWIITQVLRNQADGEWLKKHFGVEANLHLEKRGIHHYEQGKCYHGFTVPATIELGHCIFTHGTVNAKSPATKMLGKYGRNVVFGHNHTHDSDGKHLMGRDIMAACCNCLCQRQPMWKHSDPSEWTHGYAVQIVSRGGLFLHINVPIFDGVSLLGTMLDILKLSA